MICNRPLFLTSAVHVVRHSPMKTKPLINVRKHVEIFDKVIMNKNAYKNRKQFVPYKDLTG